MSSAGDELGQFSSNMQLMGALSARRNTHEREANGIEGKWFGLGKPGFEEDFPSHEGADPMVCRSIDGIPRGRDLLVTALLQRRVDQRSHYGRSRRRRGTTDGPGRGLL